MKKTLTIYILSFSLLTACSSWVNGTVYPNPSYPDPAYPSPTQTNEYLPHPGDSAFTRAEAYVDSAELLTMESFPLQFSLHLTGFLPTPCYQLRISPHAPDAKNNIYVEVYSVVNPDSICAQTTKSYDVNFPLGSYPSGHYILFVNGKQVAEFDA